jgi:FHS family L-fucose permease-like MFS transporter
VAAQFFYVGAQVGVWSYMIRYAQHEVPGMGEKAAAAYLSWSLVGFMAGRFIGTAAMSRVSPSLLMGLFAAINVGLTLVAALVGGKVGLYALASTSFFMSIMFPTIFAGSLKGLGPLTKTGSSFLVMSIIGGAVLTDADGRGLGRQRHRLRHPGALRLFRGGRAVRLHGRPRDPQDLKAAPAGAHCMMDALVCAAPGQLVWSVVRSRTGRTTRC